MLTWARRLRTLTYECGHGRRWAQAHRAAWCDCPEGESGA